MSMTDAYTYMKMIIAKWSVLLRFFQYNRFMHNHTADDEIMHCVCVCVWSWSHTNFRFQIEFAMNKTKYYAMCAIRNICQHFFFLLRLNCNWALLSPWQSCKQLLCWMAKYFLIATSNINNKSKASHCFYIPK